MLRVMGMLCQGPVVGWTSMDPTPPPDAAAVSQPVEDKTTKKKRAPRTPAKREPGRPSDLTPTTKTKLIGSLLAGNHREPACRYAGVHPATFYRWLEKGAAQTTGQYREFRDAVEAAEAEVEIRAVQQWQKAMGKSWEAARSYLATKYPERWSQRVLVTVTNELTDAISRLEARFSDRPDILEEALDAIVGGHSSAPPRLVEGEATRGTGEPSAGGGEAVQPPPPPPEAGSVSPT